MNHEKTFREVSRLNDVERWYMKVRMAAMNPDYLASHQEYTDADNAAVVDVILDYKQCEHGNARGYCAECGKANKITCHRCNGEGELYEAGEEPVSCPVCDGEAEIDFAAFEEYARQIDYYVGEVAKVKAVLRQVARLSTGWKHDEEGAHLLAIDKLCDPYRL